MVNVVLTHSALGLEGNVESWADWLRGEGHQVVTPDLYNGDVYDELDEGVAHSDTGDMHSYIDTVRNAAREMESPVVVMGFSLGAAVSEAAAMQDSSIAGAVLLFGAISPRWFGHPTWRPGLRMQLHIAPHDPWVETEQVLEFQESAPEGALEVFRYPGSSHLFAFPNHPDYEALAADRVRTEVRAFLKSFED